MMEAGRWGSGAVEDRTTYTEKTVDTSEVAPPPGNSSGMRESGQLVVMERFLTQVQHYFLKCQIRICS